MDMNLGFEIPVSSTAKDIWDMEKEQDYTRDIWGQYKYMIDYLDMVNYCNGQTFDDRLQTRHAIAYLGCAMPSLAYICPYQTTDLSYYLNLVNINLPSKFMKDVGSVFNADNMLLIQRTLAAAFYRLVSGRDMYDGEFHANARAVYKRIVGNGLSAQDIYAIDTVQSRFEAFPNFMALLALELHDRIFGTEYSDVRKKVLSCIEDKLQDKETGLFYESYQTGYFGFEGEKINPKSTWVTHELKASVNGLALAFYHCFEPEKAERAWENYKRIFTEELMSFEAEDLADKLGDSLQTQLAGESEAYFSAMLAAKEMDDMEYFDMLQKNLFEKVKPTYSQGLVFFSSLGAGQHLMGHFILFARVHAGWKKLLDHDWEKYYGYDYRKVR